MESHKLTIEKEGKSYPRSSGAAYKTVVLSDKKEYIVHGFTKAEIDTYYDISRKDPDFFPVSVKPESVEQHGAGHTYFVEWVPGVVGIVDNKFPDRLFSLSPEDKKAVQSKKAALLAVLKKMPVSDMCLLVTHEKRMVLVDYEEKAIKGAPEGLIKALDAL